jgi:hypothetical protein
MFAETVQWLDLDVISTRLTVTVSVLLCGIDLPQLVPCTCIYWRSQVYLFGVLIQFGMDS